MLQVAPHAAEDSNKEQINARVASCIDLNMEQWEERTHTRTHTYARCTIIK